MFETALKRVLKSEGGYVNDPSDSGGETYRGISRKFNPNWRGWKIIDSIEDKSKLDENIELERLVEDFYFLLWKDNLVQMVAAIDEDIAIEYFDSVVNMGYKAGVKMLQRTINKFVDKKIKVDGILGKLTLQALQESVDKVGSDRLSLSFTYKTYRVKEYVKIAQKNPKNLKFLYGWVNRAFEG